MKSRIFHSKQYESLQKKFVAALNNRAATELGVKRTPRESGDRISKIVREEAINVLGSLATRVEPSTKAKAMETFTFWDDDDLEYHVDVITHRIETSFNMPNITSVDRLINFYADDQKYFIVLIVDYESKAQKNHIKNVTLAPIEFLQWDCLTIGDLGTGQLQIKKAKDIRIDVGHSRKSWMIEFADQVNAFNVKKAKKAVSFLEISNKLKKTWKSKKDIWI